MSQVEKEAVKWLAGELAAIVAAVTKKERCQILLEFAIDFVLALHVTEEAATDFNNGHY